MGEIIKFPPTRIRYGFLTTGAEFAKYHLLLWAPDGHGGWGYRWACNCHPRVPLADLFIGMDTAKIYTDQVCRRCLARWRQLGPRSVPMEGSSGKERA